MGAIVTEDVNSVIPFTIIVESPHLEGHAGDEASLAVGSKPAPILCNACCQHTGTVPASCMQVCPVSSHDDRDLRPTTQHAACL